MKHFKYRIFSQVAVVIAGFLSAGVTMADDAAFPNSLVKVVVPYGPGGIGDYTGRAVAQYLAESWKVSAVAENRAGASGLIGMGITKNSKPDGYTVVMSSSTTISAAPYIFKNLSYDPSKDFVHLGMFGVFGSVALVRADAPYKSIPELVAHTRKHPREMFFGYTNSSSQVPPEMLNAAADLTLQAVPYKETGRAVSDLLGGQVQVMFMDYVAATPLIAGGKLIPLAVTQLQRAPLWPKVPTMAEFYPGFEFSGYVAVSAPAGTPRPVVEKYNEALRAAQKEPGLRSRLEAQGLTLPDYSVEQTNAFIAAETKKWVQYVKTARIQPE